MHLSYINDEMGFGPISPLHIGVDNSTAIAFSENSNKRSKLCHIDCRQLWVQALRDRNLCRLVKVGTDDKYPYRRQACKGVYKINISAGQTYFHLSYLYCSGFAAGTCTLIEVSLCAGAFRGTSPFLLGAVLLGAVL